MYRFVSEGDNERQRRKCVTTSLGRFFPFSSDGKEHAVNCFGEQKEDKESEQ